MADYHAILKRAISSLPSANGEARRAVYEKARSALVNQLKAFDPPLTPSEITQQRLQLEEAIRKVESEAAKGLLKPTPAVPPVLPPDAAAAAAHQPAPQTPPPAAHADAPAHEVPARPPVVDDAPSRETPPHVSGPTAPTAALRTVVDEAGQLGSATKELGRQARDALAETGLPSFGRENAEPPRRRETAERRRRRDEAINGERGPSRLPVMIGLGAAIIVFIIGIVALWSQREAISAFFGGRGEKVVDMASRGGEKLTPKVTDRIASDDAGKNGPAKPVPTQTITTQPQLQGSADAMPKQAVPLVAQKAILYEEGKAGAQAIISPGKVVWQVVPDPTAGRDAVLLRVRAEIPDRKMVVNLSMRPNADTSFPASHLVEIKFQLPPDFDGKAVTGVPGMIMKATEQSRGDPLIAASAKVADNFFWIALGSAETDRERNFKLVKERGWIDIPILYENGRRGILTLEKSGAGDAAFADAFAAWGQAN